MERRTFIYNSAFGIMGTSHILQSALKAKIHPSDNLFSTFLEALGARRQHFLAVEQALDDCGSSAALQWLNLGYEQSSLSPFWLIGRDTAFLPLQLRPEGQELLDTNLLVFCRAPNGQWRQTGTLSGFYLEAMNKALPELASRNMDAADYRRLLLPSNGNGKPCSGGWMYDTEAGSFQLSVRMAAGETTIEALVKEGRTPIWQLEFVSGSLLRCAAARHI
ncbi:MAG: hypothetical protein KF852_10030 [Saprospiraceae bacterium]|nr:hypothetical protein [Saprospiraceae bacterium]